MKEKEIKFKCISNTSNLKELSIESTQTSFCLCYSLNVKKDRMTFMSTCVAKQKAYLKYANLYML